MTICYRSNENNQSLWLLITWSYHLLKASLINQKAYVLFLNSKDKNPKKMRRRKLKIQLHWNFLSEFYLINGFLN
jgi:hypothetical protein